MIVSKDDDFETIRDFAVKFGEQVADQQQLMPDILSSPEIIGGMGMDGIIVKEGEREELAEKVGEYGEEIAVRARGCQSYEELLEAFIDISEEFWGPLHVDSDLPEPIKDEHIGVQYWIYGTGIISALDEVAGTENADTIVEFVNDLEEQEVLSKLSSVTFLFLAQDEEFLLKYANQFTRKVQPLVERLEEYIEREERDLDALVEMGVSCGPLIETAIPPLLVAIHYLEMEEVRYDRAEAMSLRDSVDYIRDFEPLAAIGEAFNVDYRNAFHHGGKTGGCTPNYLLEYVRLHYLKRGDIHTETVDAEEFEQIVFQMVSVVVALFLIPFLIITGHVTASIELMRE